MKGVYAFVNKINGKMYIGCSKDIEHRKKEHLMNAFREKSKDYDKVFYKALRKYGVDNFDFIILEYAENYLEREKYYIKLYQSYGGGYNLTIGGEGISKPGSLNPNAKLNEFDVIQIRLRYANGEQKSVVCKDYEHKITKGGFSAVWQGYSWKHIMPEVFSIKRDISKHLATNGFAKVDREDVIHIRKRRDCGEAQREVYKDYEGKISYSGFRKIWGNQTWSDV